MHSEMIPRVFGLFIVYQFGWAQQVQLPHQTCVYRPDTRALTCNRENIVFPDTFDVGSIPSDVVEIRLQCGVGEWSYYSDGYCNVMKNNAQPFPSLPNLISVDLYGFKGNYEERFAVNLLLANVKQHIESLTLDNCKLGVLDREILAGFIALKSLTVRNSIESVAWDAFQSLPALLHINLAQNRIEEFDWSALQPVADTLIGIGMNSQNPKLQTLHRSGPEFTFKKLSYLTLIDNGLSSIPKALLDTIPALDVTTENQTTVRLERNQFCPANPDCTCCETKDFFAWLDGVKKTAKPGQSIEVRYTCGSQRQNTLHKLQLVNNGTVGYKVGADDLDSRSLKAAEFNPSVTCATGPTPTDLEDEVQELFATTTPKSMERSLPHQSCWFNQRYMALACDRENLVLPDNFDVGSIPNSVVDIRLECPNAKSALNIYCNAMKANAQPFPPLPQLVSVALNGFKGEGEGRFPVNQLFTNVKQHVQKLDVRYSKIGSLEREVLAGFSALEVLTLGGNDITSVALDAFQALPSLQEIHLGHNQIKEFDWSALQPVADTLFDFGINHQSPKLQKLHRSGPPFTLTKLSFFTLIGNALSSIPKVILDTIPALDVMPGNKTRVWVEGNPFCPADPDCTCCEMNDFFTWLDGVKKAAKPGQNIEVKYTCGSQGQRSLHQLLIENGAVGYSVGANWESLRGAEFKPPVKCAVVPAPTQTVATTVETIGANQTVVSGV